VGIFWTIAFVRQQTANRAIQLATTRNFATAGY
jgi:hypothetical protein